MGGVGEERTQSARLMLSLSVVSAHPPKGTMYRCTKMSPQWAPNGHSVVTSQEFKEKVEARSLRISHRCRGR